MPRKQRVTLGWMLGLCMLGGSGSVWAVNKCVATDGKVSFQDEPCAADQTAQEISVTPSSKGVTPTAGSKPLAPAHKSAAPRADAAAVPARPADCPSPQEMQQLQTETESIALPLPIRNQKRQDFDALKQRCQ